MTYAEYPRVVVEDIARLRRQLDRCGVPARRTDANLLIATWNVRNFGRVHESWDENADSPKRNLRSLAYLTEIIRRFDVVAIQEIRRDTAGIRYLLDHFLGPNWSVLLSDVTAGEKGNHERLAYLYDRRRVTPSGLAGEIVLPPAPAGDPVTQFDRTPYIVGFRAGDERFALLTVHIRYGVGPEDRIDELRALAEYSARELRDRARAQRAEETNLIVLGDFNIDERGDNPLFQALVAQGLIVPPPLLNVATTYGSTAKHYDQIAWFMGDLTLRTEDRAGVVNFSTCVYKELQPRQMSDRVSDHFPLWIEFLTDRSEETFAQTLGVDPSRPDPLGTVPD